MGGGEGGIRTPGTVTRTPHFECGAFNHSATSPWRRARECQPALCKQDALTKQERAGRTFLGCHLPDRADDDAGESSIVAHHHGFPWTIVSTSQRRRTPPILARAWVKTGGADRGGGPRLGGRISW